MRSQWALLFSLCTLGSFYSCAPSSFDEQSPLPISEVAISEGDLSQSEEWIKTDWWLNFRDAQLTQLIQAALIHNPTLKEAESAFEASGGIVEAMRSKYLPDFGIQLSHDTTKYSAQSLLRDHTPMREVIHTTTGALNFSYEVDFWGKNRHLVRSAIGEQKARCAELDQAKLIIASLVANTYFALQANHTSKLLYADLHEKLSYKEKLLKQRFDAGIDRIMRVDATARARLDIEVMEEKLKEEEQKLSHMMIRLLGKNNDEPLKLSFPLMPATHTVTIPSEIKLNLIHHRPDLTALLWETDALASEVGAAKAAFYPNINLSALFGISSIEIKKLFRDSSLTAGITPAIHLPIFNLGKIKGNYRSKMAQFNGAIHRYNGAVLTAVQEVSDAIHEITSIKNQINTVNASIGKSESDVTHFSARYVHGVDSFIPVLDSAITLQMETLKQVGLRRESCQRVVSLYKALGGGYTYEEIEDE